jgi:hypothetical protein
MKQQIKKLWTLNYFLGHLFMAVFCCIVLFQLDMQIIYDKIWYDKVIIWWSVLLIIHLIALVAYHLMRLRKKKTH